MNRRPPSSRVLHLIGDKTGRGDGSSPQSAGLEEGAEAAPKTRDRKRAARRECTGHGAARKDHAAKKDRARERTASLDMRAISSSVWGIPLSSHFLMIPIRP